VVVNDKELRLLEDLDAWLGEVAPARDDFKHRRRFESNAFSEPAAASPGFRVYGTAARPGAPIKLCFFIELDGLRPKRTLVKVMDE